MNEVKKLIINGEEFVVTDGGAIAFDATQSLSENQKKTARQNIGAAAVGEAGGGSADAVLYTEQELADDQKAQARTNIGAISMEEVEELLGIEEEFSVTGEVVEFNVDVEPDTKLEVISKIHRDETWGLSNKLVLHQTSGTNFVDFSGFLGGVGKVITKNGLTATVNADSTVTIQGTNSSSGWTSIIELYRWEGVHSEKVYPAGTYTVPSGFSIAIRAARHPKNNTITGFDGFLSETVTIPEPFRIVCLRHSVQGGATVDETLLLGLFYGSSIPETGREYSGILHTVTFDNPVYEGEFNWSTGELKDVDGNTIGYYDVPEIKSLPGTNYFWTGFGENTVSNASNNLGKVVLRLNETAPEDTIPSICDFMFTPTTPSAAYGLYSAPFLGGGQFSGNEVPVLTTKGTLSVKDIDGNVKYSKYIDPMFNTRGVSDVLTNRGLEKKWSKKFYLNKEPVSTTYVPPVYTGALDNYVFVWEFDESEFANTGIPAKIQDIAIASPCFRNNDSSKSQITGYVEIWNGTPYPAFFSYNAETGKYTLSARGIQGDSIKHQLTNYSKVHFYYQLETPYTLPFTFAMGIDAGDTISFEADLTDNQPYIDALPNFQNRSVEPTVTAFIPRNVEDAMTGMNNAAMMLNMDDATGGDATVQGYSWIGEGDGTTDYTVQIQSKIDELRTTSNGGTIHLGPGTYPISKSLIVSGNIQIFGDGYTVIEQRADNTHAVIWNGSNIRMCDLTIKLAGACTENTACIFANSNNTTSGVRNEKYPENMYVQNCSANNITLKGTYGFSWKEGYPYLSDKALAYRGVGISGAMYFNFCDFDGVFCRNLYAGIYNGGGANHYRIYVPDSRFAVYGGGGNNIFDINAHTYYGYGQDGQLILGTEYAFYGREAESNMITMILYDSQYSKGQLYFDGRCKDNRYSGPSYTSGLSNDAGSFWKSGYRAVTDYGRGNAHVQTFPENFVGIGSHLYGISGLPIWNTQFSPSVNNALSGAGVWGSITSNKEWTNNGIDLSDACRYPKDTLKTYFGLASAICKVSPSEESPIEIIIDISDRPVTNYKGFWIQFDHRYVAEEYTVSFDTTNDGVFDLLARTITGNDQPVSYGFNYQEPSLMIYRIKISITKALQIPEFTYSDANYEVYTINYNPDGYIGIVNIGMPSNEAYGRAFLGECGGSLYGNVDMHQNTLKNLPDPVDEGDAVSKAYLEERLATSAEEIGDIETALDAIIDIQNSLIGGDGA